MNKTEIKRGIGTKVHVYRMSATMPLDGTYVISGWEETVQYIDGKKHTCFKAVVEHENSKRYPGSIFIDSKYVHRLEVE